MSPSILSNGICTTQSPIKCEVGFYAFGTECRPCSSVVPQCATCNSAGTQCLSCQFPFTLKGNFCLDQTIILPCEPPKILYNGRCIDKINHCVSYQDNDLCRFCEPGYLVTLYGSCTPRGYNLRCEPGFWLNKDLDACLPVDKGCDYYYESNGRCVNCTAGYVMDNGNCVPG